MNTSFIIGKADLNKFMEKMSSLNKDLFSYNVQLKISAIKDIMARTKNGSYVNAQKIEVENPFIENSNKFAFVGFAEKNTERTEWIYYQLDDNIRLEVKKNNCDLCHIHHNRVSYYFFKKEDEILQIGSSCVDAFFGAPIRKTLDNWVKFIKNAIQIKKEATSFNGENYCIEDIYAAAKSATNNWESWEKKITTHNVINMIANESFEDISLIDIKKGLKLTKNYYGNNTDDFSRDILNILCNDDNFRRYIDRKNIGLIAYAFYKAHNYALSSNIIEGEWIGNIGDKITVEGDLYFTGTEKNPYTPYYSSTTLYHYELITEENNHFYIRTSKEIADLVNRCTDNLRAIVSGIIGYKGRTKSIKYNSLKGRTKITLL